MKRRSSVLRYCGDVELGKSPPVVIRGYNKDGDFVCRLEVNAAGIAIYAGGKGNRHIADKTWEDLIANL